jgi:general secretion pathway protein F
MAVFRYEALTPEGARIEGELDAPSLDAAIDAVKALGHFLIAAEERPTRTARHGGWLRRGRIAPKAVVAVTGELATLLAAKLPLDHALGVLVDVAESEVVRKLLTRIRERVREGASLAEALSDHPEVFSRLYVSLVRAGEAGASLDVVAARLAAFLERSQELREKVGSALIYPAILLSVAVLSLVLLFTVVLPEFQPLFESAGRDLPWATQAVMAVGHAMEVFGPAASVGFLAVALAARRLLAEPVWRLRWDAGLLCVPVLRRLIAALEAARLTRSLGMLLANGLPAPIALAAAAETIGNAAIRSRLAAAVESLREGQGLAGPLERAAVLPPMAIHLIAVGEETGQLENMLSKAADIHDAAFRRDVDRMISLLVPGLTLVLGAVVAAIIASVLLAVLSVNELAL